MKIIIDAMGGDNAPLEIVKGALLGMEHWGVEVLLTGDTEAILRALRDCGHDTIPRGMEIVHTTETVEMCDDPSKVFRHKKDTSMGVGLTLLRDGKADALVSAGSTGALLAGATLITKRIRGIRRAAMAPVIPTTGGKAVLIDCGANAECTPEYLMQFAYLGSFYASRVLGLERPRVGLLNIGAEDSKGTDLQRETLALLRKAGEEGHLNFIGNIEAKEAIKGGCDVIVTDGFSGNILLKTMEGVGSFARSRPGGYFPEEPADQAGRRHGDAGAAGIQGPAGPQQGGGHRFHRHLQARHQGPRLLQRRGHRQRHRPGQAGGRKRHHWTDSGKCASDAGAAGIIHKKGIDRPDQLPYYFPRQSPKGGIIS